MKNIDFTEYHNFLKKRTIKSHLYRNLWLYPFLCMNLSGRTLDIGSGIGDFVKYRKNTIGVDINLDNVEYCKKLRNLDVRLMKEDVLPFEANEFNSVNMDNVLEHIKDPKNLLKEIDRVLKKEGILIVGVPAIHGFNSAPDHEVFYSKKDLTNLFTKRGYFQKKLYCLPFKCDWLFENYLSQYCYYSVFIKNF